MNSPESLPVKNFRPRSLSGDGNKGLLVFVVTDGLTKKYSHVTALDQCSLSVERGEVFGLLGPNGSGKTTLLRLLLGFLHPTSGTARIDQFDCTLQSVAAHRQLAYLPGDARLYRQMRGRDLLAFFASLRPDNSLQRARQLAQRLDLDLARRVSLMSTGMRQKLALAVTLSIDAPLLILDEPTANLDPTVRATVTELILEARSRQRTVLLSSHILPEIEQVCDRVAILCQGRLVHTQVMSELRRRHRIRARLRGPFSKPPNELASLSIQTGPDGHVVIETCGDLAPLLGWLSTTTLDEIQIEPLGLRPVYDRFHANPATLDTPSRGDVRL